MTSPETSVFHKGIVTMLTHRAGSGADATGVATVVRSAYDDLAAALVPLISQVGVDALVARAFHLAQREYPLDQAGEEQPAEPFAQVLRWVERQDDPTHAADAAATERLAIERYYGLCLVSTTPIPTLDERHVIKCRKRCEGAIRRLYLTGNTRLSSGKRA